MTTVAVKGETRVVRPLPVLVPLIKDELAAGYKAGVEHYRRVGEMLIEAKSQLDPDEWQPWLKRNFELGGETARRYMLLARKSDENENARIRAPRTLSELMGDARTGPEKAFRSVASQTIRINLERLDRERQSREHEAKLVKQLAYQLIDIGYRVLSTKLHPDKGGSHQAMKRLNHVRDLLRRAV
jgi:hypothetical protein